MVDFIVTAKKEPAMPEIRLYDVMGFGEHRDMVCIEVICNHPDYIGWMIANTDRVLSNDAYLYYIKLYGVPE